ncbi:MAG: DUF6036 family nucleotidyltransferase [bacterium]
MLNQIDILKDISQRLQTAHISFMVTGSMALNYYAQPRMTRDIDIIISLTKSRIKDIINLFKDDYYISSTAVEESVANRSIFNILHNESIIKVDFIIQKQTEYRQIEFERRQKVSIRDFETFLVSKEDLIISKLIWGKDSRSELQKRDILNLISTGFDQKYLNSWITRLGLKTYYEEIISG